MVRLFSIALGIFAWISVAACAHHLDTAHASSVTWNLFVAGDEAHLAYGQPNSDLVGVKLTCQRGSNAVLIAGDVPSENARLVLASGRQRLALEGAASPDPFTGAYWMEANASTRSAALKRFAQTGDLSLVKRLGSLDMRASEQAKGDIRRFFAHCEA